MELSGRTALVTGGARRIGRAIARHLHAAGMRVVIHHRSSEREARALAEELEAERAGSATVVHGDVSRVEDCARIVADAVELTGSLDLLVNNASSFFPTPVGGVDADAWDDLMGSNLRGPFFLSQAAATALTRNRGAIVNLLDIHARFPMKGHPVYSAAKAGLAMLTRSLAVELAPAVRVNGVAPGAILWPDPKPTEAEQAAVRAGIPLERIGEPLDIAEAVRFLAAADYITGQILAVDGGRSLTR